MNEIRKRLVVAAGVVCFSVAAANAEGGRRTAAEHLTAGNRLLAERQYDDALAAYDKAAEALPRSAEVAYNRGIALYRLGRFDEAQTAFQDVLTRRRPALEPNAKFNLGRSAQAAAMQKADDLKAAVDDLGRAIGFYKDTLQLRPDHAAAKKNLADAQRLRGFLKKIMEMMPKEEKKEDDQKKCDKSDAESQPDKDGEKQDSQQSDGEDDDQQSDGEKDDQQQQAQDDSDDSDDEGDPAKDSDAQQEPSTQQSTQPTEEPMTQPATQPATAPTSQPPQSATTRPSAEMDEHDIEREEAERMLQEARDAERKRRAEKRRRSLSRQGRIPVDRDW